MIAGAGLTTAIPPLHNKEGLTKEIYWRNRKQLTYATLQEQNLTATGREVLKKWYTCGTAESGSQALCSFAL